MTPSPVDLIIFDLDGTLVNAYAAVARSINFTLTQAGFPPLDRQTIVRSVGWGDRHLIKKFVGEKLADKTLRVYRRHHALSLQQDVRFLPGARQVLARLKRQGFRLAIASNRPTKYSRIILRTLGIEGQFDYVLCGDKLKRAKPYPDILLAILKKLKRRPDQTLYVGDMTIDVVTGRRAGVRTVAVVTGSSTRRELASTKPYRIIRRMSSLPAIIDHINQNGSNVVERRKS